MRVRSWEKESCKRVDLICCGGIDVIALLGWSGVVVRFLLCMIILQKLVKWGRSWVGAGDVRH